MRGFARLACVNFLGFLCKPFLLDLLGCLGKMYECDIAYNMARAAEGFAMSTRRQFFDFRGQWLDVPVKGKTRGEVLRKSCG